jgi:hypothetical protein
MPTCHARGPSSRSDTLDIAECPSVTHLEYSAAAFDDPSVGLFYLYPLEFSWPDDRKLVCIAVSLDGPATGSYADR